MFSAPSASADVCVELYVQVLSVDETVEPKCVPYSMVEHCNDTGTGLGTTFTVRFHACVPWI
jgi:hypothetical protein